MTRGVGLADAAGTSLPPTVTAVLTALTHLGDPVVLVAVATLAYWVWDRDRGAALLSLAVGALALVVLLKATFALPRPPASLHAVPADGFGFPSGHALGAAAVIGGLAAATDAWTGPRRAVVAGVLIAVVAVSRVGLGVHYAVDVVVGVTIGLGYLAVHRWALPRDGSRGFSLAVLVAVAGLGVAGPTRDALALVGLAVGGLIALRVTPTPPVARLGRDLPVAAVGIPVAVGLGATAAGPWAPTPVVPVAGAALAGGVIALPTVAARLVGTAPSR